jgi:hypothetical protein
MGQVLGMTRGAACLLEKSEYRVQIEHLYAYSRAGNVPVTRFLP